MRLTEKYAHQLAKVEKSTLLEILEDIDIFDLSLPPPKKVDPKTTIAVGAATPLKTIITLLRDYEIEHFVQTNRNDFFFDLFAASLMLKKPSRFMKNPVPFFIQNFKKDLIKHHEVRSKTWTFQSTAQKNTIMGELENFLSGHARTQNYSSSAIMIADELVSNALFSAPVDEDSKALYQNLPRSSSIVLDMSKECELFVSHDEHRLLLGCTDPFGSVDMKKIIQRLYTIYVLEDSKPDLKSQSAGLGIKMMIDNSCGFYLVYKRNIKTLVCCAIPISLSYKKSELYPKNLHFSMF